MVLFSQKINIYLSSYKFRRLKLLSRVRLIRFKFKDNLDVQIYTRDE